MVVLKAGAEGQAGEPISRDLAGGDELVEIDLNYSMSDPVEKARHRAKVSWNALFYGIAGELITERPKYEIKQALICTIAAQVWQTPLSDEMTKRTKPKDYKEFLRRTDIADDSFTMVMLQFIALGVIEVSSIMKKRSDPGPVYGPQEFLEQVWKLTRSGLRAYLETKVQHKG